MIAILTWCLAGAHTATAQSDQQIYDDSLQNGWEDWSWCTRDLNNPTPVHEGGKSISVSCGPWEALSLAHAAFSTSPYSNLVFWAHGGTAGGQSLHLMAQRSSGNPTNFVWVGPLTAGAWQRFVVPLEGLGVDNVPDCTVFWIRNYNRSPLPTFCLDGVALEVGETLPPPPPPGSTILLEAENGTLNGVTTSSSAPGYSGSGYATGFDAAGDAVSWTFSAQAGLHRLWIRFRSPYGQKGYEGAVNGMGLSGMFPQTDAFEAFDAGLVELAAGANTLQIGGGWNYYEIDRADLVPTSTPPPPSSIPAAPADLEATFATRMLLADLAADYGQVTWSGQQDQSEVANVFQKSGRKPLIVSGDFMDYSPSRIAYGANPGQLTETMIGLETSGHVAAMCWHWNAPTNLLNTQEQPWWRGFYTAATTFDVAAALADTNSTEYALLLRDMDAIAAQLRKFASNNVPVLWRPLHESEGGWFWWGAKGPEPFKRLWRLLFERLTEHHGLHNLIWVLTSEDPAWYPGDDVVDIVGVDAYPADPGDPLSSRWEALKARFDGSKMIALTEFGGVPDIEKMQQFGVWFTYFAPWTGPYGPGAMPNETVARIYQSPGVITLDEANARAPRITTQGWSAEGMMEIAGQGPRGAAYRILATTSPNLPEGPWTPVATNKFRGGVFEFIDPDTASHPVRFYRVVKP